MKKKSRRKKQFKVRSHRRYLTPRKYIIVKSYVKKKKPRVVYHKPEEFKKRYVTGEKDIAQIGFRRYYGYYKKGIERIKGKTQVNVSMKVWDWKGRRNRDIVGVEGLGLPKHRRNWRNAIGDYIHSQLAEYNLYIAHYKTDFRKRRFKKSRKVLISLEFYSL